MEKAYCDINIPVNSINIFLEEQPELSAVALTVSVTGLLL